MSTTKYCTRSEVELLFSRTGVNLRTDDPGDSTGIMDFCIDDASSTLEAYASQWYDEADLAGSRWVRIRCIWMSAYVLSQRRGNPSLFFARYEQIIQELEQVRDGALPIPGLSSRADMVPTLSNIVHDPRNRIRTLRVQPEISTGTNSSKQDLEDYYIPDYNG